MRKVTHVANKLLRLWSPEHMVCRPLELIYRRDAEDFGPVRRRSPRVLEAESNGPSWGAIRRPDVD